MSTILVSIKQSVMAIIQNSTDHFCEWMKLRGSNSVYYTPWQVLANYGRPAWCGLSANLGCRPETRCTQIAANTGRKKSQKIAIWAPSHNFIGYIFATKACVYNRKKLAKQQYLPHMPPQYGELRPSSG